MENIIEKFLANVKGLHELQAKNLPDEVVEYMANMSAEELYKTCTQFVVLQNNIPSEDKILTLDENELLFLVEEYGQELLKRIQGR